VAVNKQKIIGLLISLIIAVCIACWWMSVSHQASYSEKVLRFSFTLKNTSSQFLPYANFSIAIPADIDGYQSVKNIDSKHPYVSHDLALRLKSISFNVDNFSPYSSRIVDLMMVIQSNGKSASDIDKNIDYLKNEKYIEVESPIVVTLAKKLKDESDRKTAENIYTWLINNINASEYTAIAKGARFALEKRMGDCSEFMYAFVALARANRIPARGVSGFYLPNHSAVINAVDYHDWAEFYDGSKWILVDAKNKQFDQSYEDYIVLNYIGELAGSTARFSVSDQKISVSL